jgi:hypothetical protein
MSKQRTLILVGLALLTIIFISAAAFMFLDNRFESDFQGVEPLPLGEAPSALRMTITEDGIAAITAKQLRATNLPIEAFSPENLNLTVQGQPVPFHVIGDGNDAIILFYAQALTDTLDAPAVYLLAPGSGIEMSEENASPGEQAEAAGRRQQKWEENEQFLAQAAGEDVWLGKLLFAPSSLDLTLEGIQPTEGEAEITVRIWSNNQAKTEPDHHVEILLNGKKIKDHFWDGIKQETIRIPVDAGILKPSDNILTITAPGDTGAAGEALYIDWVRLAYDGHLVIGEEELWFQSDAANLSIEGADRSMLVFDISDPAAPTLLKETEREGDELRFAGHDGGTFLVFSPNNVTQPPISLVPLLEPLSGPERGADYIAIIADDQDFAGSIQPLLDYREDQGLSTVMIPASQVYDEFGHGRKTTTAIRDFLAYSVEEWDPTPRFALLVGDASYDIYDYANGKNENLLPSHLVYTEFAGYVATDTWFTMFDEESLMPGIAIGRFPVQTKEQLDTMVAKTLAYERSADSDWVGRALLVADDEVSFDDASDDLAGELDLVGYQTQKLYMTENENIHDAIVSALNQGVGIVNYVGHGSVEVWGDERVFQAEDADILINGNRLPIFTTFTCLNGYFNHPDVDALAETLLWAEDGGVVASIAPSGRSLTSQQLPLAQEFYRHLLSGEATTLGEALQLAKITGAENDFLVDVIHTFNLLGDPALKFQIPNHQQAG